MAQMKSSLYVAHIPINGTNVNAALMWHHIPINGTNEMQPLCGTTFQLMTQMKSSLYVAPHSN
jgi:hypothetical protein